MILNKLLKERPSFHGRHEAGSKNYMIQASVLKYLNENVPVGGHSLETGCGYSTLVFAERSRHHRVISPFHEEHDAIQEWAQKHSFPTSHVDFIPMPSQDHLPNLEPSQPYDFILIDGDHAFPAPLIDWYYTADHLRPGGLLAIDDIHIPTGRVLTDFLEKETQRWKRRTTIDKTVVFQRTTENPVARGVMWTEQPFCRIPASDSLARVRRALRRAVASASQKFGAAKNSTHRSS